MSTFNGGPQGIVTNGLVLYLDAANRDSYVSGSTAWNDLSRSRINGTLTNGPTFDNGNAGTIKFDSCCVSNDTTGNTCCASRNPSAAVMHI